MWQGVCFGMGVMIGLTVPGLLMIFSVLVAGWLIDELKVLKKQRKNSEFAQYSNSDVVVSLNPLRIEVRRTETPKLPASTATITSIRAVVLQDKAIGRNSEMGFLSETKAE